MKSKNKTSIIFSYQVSQFLLYGYLEEFRQINGSFNISSLVFIMRRTYWKIILIFVLALSVLGSSKDSHFDQHTDDVAETAVGEASLGYVRAIENYRAVKLVKVGRAKGSHIFFVVTQLNGSVSEEINIAIFKEGTQKPMITCHGTNIDVCFLATSELTQDQVLVVAIQCKEEGDFKFETYWSNVDKLIPNKEERFYFTGVQSAALYQTDLQGKEFKEIRITLIPETKRTPGDSVKIYGNFGFEKEPTITEHNFESHNLWKDGQGIFMTDKDLSMNKKLTLLMIGKTETMYQLKLELVSESNYQIQPITRIYEYLPNGAVKNYHLTFNGNEFVEQYSLSFAKFSGDLQTSFYKDKQMIVPFVPQFYEYMGDIKYLFVKQQVTTDDLKELYISVKATKLNAVYMIAYDFREANGAVQITQSIYDFLPITKEKIVYLHFENFGNSTATKQLQGVDVNIINIVGNVSASFRICKGVAIKCLQLDSFKKESKELIETDSSFVGMKHTYKLKVNPQDFFTISDLQYAGIILVILKNEDIDPSLVAIEYLLGDSIHDLRQDHPIQSIIDKSERKYYKFLNSDPSVKQVRIHISTIRGQVEFYGIQQDPRTSMQSPIIPVGNQIIFTQNLGQAMYAVVDGVISAVYCITVQLSHEGAESSSISFAENIEYTIRISPNSVEVVKLHPIFTDLYFSYKATSSIRVCILNKDEVCQQDTKPEIGKVGEIKLKDDPSHFYHLLVGNPSSDRFVEVKMIYRSSNYDHCATKTMEDIHIQNIKHGDCIEFPIRTPFSSMLFVIERIDIGPMSVQMFACSKKIDKEFVLPSLKVSPNDIASRCMNASSQERSIQLIFEGDSQKQDASMKVQISGIYENSIVNLADGVAFRTSGKSVEGKLNTYYYHVINLIKTTVVLRNFRGSYNFYVKIIDATERQSSTVNMENYDYQSQSSNFFQNPSLVIAADDFLKKSCDQCGLLIAVYSAQDVGGLIDYSIEVIQNYILLKDNQSLDNHLLKNSIAYYDYESHQEKGHCNLIFEVSDHNQNCAQIYLSDKQTPSADNFLIKEFGNKLTYSECEKKNYYIAIEAVEDCPYSISVINSIYSVSRIERGKPVNINLSEGEVRYFIFRHMALAGFKLATINKFGAVNIYATSLDGAHLEILKRGEHLDYQSFPFKSSFTDVLTILSTQIGSCNGCYYIVAVAAIRVTQSSLILADDETPISMIPGKIFNDQLLATSDDTVLTFKNILSGMLSLSVHSGTIHTLITYKKKTIIQHTFEKRKQQQFCEFDLTLTNNIAQKYDWQPTKVFITCVTGNCLYSVGLVDSTSEKASADDAQIVPGVPSYLFLQSAKTKCATGFLKEKSDEIVVTVDRINAENLEDIELSLKLDGKQVKEFVKNKIMNVMTITPISNVLKIASATPYRLCLSLKQDKNISVVVEQGEDINLLPEDYQVVVRNESTFLVYPEGPFLVDIFECAGETTFNHGYSQEDIKDQMTDLANIGMPEQPHAIKINSILPTFLKFKTELSIVRWLPIDEANERGLGYYKYKAGDLKYETNENSITVIWNGIAKSKETQTVVKDISYKLFISDNIKNLKSASSCQKFLANDVLMIELDIPQNHNQEQNITYIISKFTIGHKFKGRKDNIYFNLVADVALAVPKTNIIDNDEPYNEYYRFFYHAQEIPKDVFIGHENSIFDSLLVIAAILLGIMILIIAIFYVIMKKLIPIISRMRNQMMVEDPPQIEVGKVDQIQSNERIVVEE